MNPSLKTLLLFLSILLAMLFVPGPVHAQTSLTYVQGQSNSFNGSISSPDTDGWPGNVTSGHLLVHIFIYAAGAGTVTYSDAQGNTYNRCAVGSPFADSNGIHIDLVWTKATATGANGITNTFAGSGSLRTGCFNPLNQDSGASLPPDIPAPNLMSNNVTNHIGEIHIHTQATDAKGIAASLGRGTDWLTFASQANSAVR